MYSQGEGVAKDQSKAAHWFRLAAEQGDVTGQYNLGVQYANGEGVPEDNVQAYAWMSIAAAQGHTSAKTTKEKVEKSMTREQIAEAQKLSRRYWDTYGPGRKDK